LKSITHVPTPVNDTTPPDNEQPALDASSEIATGNPEDAVADGV
jgi:hypothetical protein